MQPSLFLPVFVVGASLSVALLERFPPLRFTSSPFLRPWFATDLAWQLSTFGLPILARPMLIDAIPPLLADIWGQLPFVVTAAAAIVLYDFVAFAIHRAFHRFEPLWSIHKVHHSSRTLDWLATTRQHVFEGLIRNLPSQAVLILCGFPVEAIAVALGSYAAFALLGHSNLRPSLAWLEPLFVTPRVHRCHHVPATTDKNFGTIFSVWDRLTGSLIVCDTESGELLGVPGEIETYPQAYRRALVEPLRGWRGRGTAQARCGDLGVRTDQPGRGRGREAG